MVPYVRLSLGSKLQLAGFASPVQSRWPPGQCHPPITTAPEKWMKSVCLKYPRKLGRKELPSIPCYRKRESVCRGDAVCPHVTSAPQPSEGGSTTPALHDRVLNMTKSSLPEVLESESRIPSSKLCAPCQGLLFSRTGL